MKKLSSLYALTFIVIVSASAQQTMRFNDKMVLMKEALYFQTVGAYRQSLQSVERFFELQKNATATSFSVTDFELAQAHWVYKMSKVFLKYDNAKEELQSFLNTTPYLSIRQLGSFHLAKYYYAKNDFKAAIPMYEKSGINYLSNQELSERNFELAYSYLVSGQLDKVQPLFAASKNLPGEYNKPGNYYHGIMSYYHGNYEAAKSSFNAVANEPAYSNVVPFYLTEIDYLTGEKEMALQKALTYVSKEKKLYYHNELYQLLGQIYYEKGDYPKAEAYLSSYMQQCESPFREDFYRLGYAQMQQAKTDEAIVSFKKINSYDAQFLAKVNYHLGILSLTKGNKNDGYQYLKLYAKQNEINEHKEEVAFNVAKLSLDLKNDTEAEKELQNFMRDYATSVKKEEVNLMLLNLYLKQNKMDAAKETLNLMSGSNEAVKKKFQQANFNNAILSYNQSNYADAIEHLNESLRQPVDDDLVKQAQYVLSEAHFRMSNFGDAVYHADNVLSETNLKNEMKERLNRLKTYSLLMQHDTLNAKLAAQEIPHFEGIDSVGNIMMEKPPLIENMKSLEGELEPIFVYDLPTLETQFIYTPVPLSPLALNNTKLQKSYLNYVKASIGNLSAYQFAAGIDLSNGLQAPAYIEFQRSSTTGKLVSQQINRTLVGFATEHLAGKYRIANQFSVERNKLNYYGYDKVLFNNDNTDVKQIFSTINTMASLKGLHIKGMNWKQDPQIGLGVFFDKFQAKEMNMQIHLPWIKQLNHQYQLGLAIHGNWNFFGVKNHNMQTSHVVSVEPVLIKQLKGVDLQIGLFPTFAQQFHLLPNVEVSMPMQKNKMILRGGFTSKVNANTYKSLSTTNPFIQNSLAISQSKQSELFAGIKGTLYQNISFSSKLGLMQITKLPLFVNDSNYQFKQFAVLYDHKASILNVEANVDYTIHKDLCVGASLQFKPILKLTDAKEAWGYVPAEWTIYGKLNATKKLQLTADAFMQAGTKSLKREQGSLNAYATSLAGIVDANAKAILNIHQQWNFTCEINNVLNNTYQRWFGYDSFGRNLQIGFMHLFNKPKYIPNNFFN
jgi:TolA-binding protein